MYVWFSQLGFPHSTLEFPYKRQSPITKKNKEYESITFFCKQLGVNRNVVYKWLNQVSIKTLEKHNIHHLSNLKEYTEERGI